MEIERFTASMLKDLTPDEVVIDDKGVTFKIKKMIGGSEQFVFFKDISGVEIDHGMFFSTIRVIPRARPEIVIDNFTRDDANRIKHLILERVRS